MRGSYFDGTLWGYIGIHLLAGLLTMLTLGFATPWSYCLIKGWEMKHRVVNNRRLKFTGKGIQVVGNWALLLIVSYLVFLSAGYFIINLSRSTIQGVLALAYIIAVILYIPFVRLLILKWFAKHTEFDDRGPASSEPVEDMPYTPPQVIPSNQILSEKKLTEASENIEPYTIAFDEKTIRSLNDAAFEDYSKGYTAYAKTVGLDDDPEIIAEMEKTINIIKSETVRRAELRLGKKEKAQLNSSPLFSLVFGTFITIVGWIVAMFVHWGGWPITAVGLGVLIYTYYAQN